MVASLKQTLPILIRTTMMVRIRINIRKKILFIFFLKQKKGDFLHFSFLNFQIFGFR